MVGKIASSLHTQSVLPWDFSLGLLGNSASWVASRMNIPYTYLPDACIESIPGLVDNLVVPRLQERLRRNERPYILESAISAQVAKQMNTDVRQYIWSLRSAYASRVNTHRRIASFIGGCPVGNGLVLAPSPLGREWGLRLLSESREIEAQFFCLSSQMKAIVDREIGIALEERPTLGPDLVLLLMTPSFPPYPVAVQLDISLWRQSGAKTERERCRQWICALHLNGHDVLFDGFVAKYGSLPGRAEIRHGAQTGLEQKIESAVVRKRYFLLEHPWRRSREIDELLLFDHCLDKYMDSKCCFLHDLFLDILLRSESGGLPLDPESLAVEVQASLARLA